MCQRQEQSTEEGGVGQQGRDGSGGGGGTGSSSLPSEPHMVFTYDDKQILEDAAALIIYHVKRQPAIHKDDKDHIKRIVQHFVPDLFFSRRGELSDTEDWTDEEAEPEDHGERGEGGASAGSGGGSSNSSSTAGATATTGNQQQQLQQGPPQSQPQQLNGESRRRRCSPPQPAANADTDSASQGVGPPTNPGPAPQEGMAEKVDLRDPEAEHQKEMDGVYNLLFVNNNWYFFLRLHQTLCSRLLRVYRQAERQLLDHRAEQSRERLLMAEGRRDKASDLAMELRLKQPSKSDL